METKIKNLVIGATGILGSEVCRLLIEKKLPVRAMVRESSDPVKVNRLRELGVEIAYGDLRKTSTFKPILQNIDHVIVTASSMPFSYAPNENDPILVDRNGMISLIDESRRSRIRHFIFTSFSGNIKIDFPLSRAKRTVERYLQKNGMPYTILRPGFFMEAWFSPMVGFDPENAKVKVYGNGNEPVCYISLFDVARFAIECLDNPAARNATLELGGPEKISQWEAVKIFEELKRKKFEVQYEPVEALQRQLESATDPMQKSFSGLMLSIAKGDPIEMENILSIYPIKLKSVKEYAKNMLKTYVFH